MICNHIFNVKLGLETNTEQIPAENVNDNIYYRCDIYILFHAHYTVNRTYISNIYVHLFCNVAIFICPKKFFIVVLSLNQVFCLLMSLLLLHGTKL